MFTKKLLAGIAISAIFLAGCATTPADNADNTTDGDNTVTIGGQFPLTGDLAAIGNGQMNGAMLAIKQVNDAGGVNGMVLKMVVEDDQCDQTLAVSAFTKLATSDDVEAIVGPACSPSSLAIIPITESEKVVSISPSATDQKLTTNGGHFFFRTAPSDALRMQQFAQFAIDNTEVDKLAVIFMNNTYGVGAKDYFVQEFVRLGGEIVLEESFNRETIDYKTQLQKIKDSDASGFWQISYAEGTGLIYKQARELGLEGEFYNGYEGFDDPQGFEIGKDALNGVWYAGNRAADPAFVTAYVAEYGEDPVTYAAEAYDAVMLIVEAMNSGAMTGEEIADALLKGDEFVGASGTFSVDKNGDVAKEFDLIQIRDGAPVVVKPL